MKERWLFYFIVLAGFSCLGLSLLQGCNSSTPILASLPVKIIPSSLVTDFDDGSMAASPSLKGCDILNGSGQVGVSQTEINGDAVNPLPYGPATVSGITVVSPVPGGPSGTGNYLQIISPFSSATTSIMLSFRFNTNLSQPYFDASCYQGLIFDMNLPPLSVSGGVTTGESASNTRVFTIFIGRTVPPSNFVGGICGADPSMPNPGDCWNNFHYDIVSTTAGWKSVTLLFAPGQSNSVTQFQYWGAIPLPNQNLNSPGNLKQFLQFQWSDNGPAGNHMDFSVDNIRFY
jgi:hypothetical protein